MEQVNKITIRPNTDKMVKSKSASGGKSYHSDDVIGHALSGLSLESVKKTADTFGVSYSSYENLNSGQQRMCIGGKLRKFLRDNPDSVDGIVSVTNELRHSQPGPEKKVRARTAKTKTE